MTPLIRPRFLRWSLVVFAVLVPLAIHALWDAIEARRMRAAIDALAATGAPVTEEQVTWRPTVEPSRDAAPYYTAAAALVRGYAPSNDFVRALREGSVPQDVLRRVRDDLAESQEALQLLDRATSLEYLRFAPGTDYGYRGSELNALASLCTLRTMYAAVTGDGEAAASSLRAELRLFGASHTPIPLDWFHRSKQTPERLQLILSKSVLTEQTLARLAADLAWADEDDRLTKEVLAARARGIERFVGKAGYSYTGPGIVSEFGRNGGNLWDAILRPYVALRMRSELDAFAALIAASQRPWPDRLDAIRAVHAAPSDGGWGQGWAASYQHELVDSPMGSIATDTAAIRTARVAVAIERSRARHGGRLPASFDQLVPDLLDAVPIDPYSGKPLQYRQVESGYLVYSLGENRADDGGDFEDTRERDKAGRVVGHPSKDIGLRVVRERRSY
jgi:hypothetical protein